MRTTHRLGMRLLSLTLSVLCALSMASTASATTADAFPKEDKTPVQSQTLTTIVRADAYFGATNIGQMEHGTQITVLGTYNSFYKVDCYDMVGYIAKSQVRQTEDGTYIIDCKEDSDETGVMNYTNHVDALKMRHSMLKLAQEQLGEPYIYGGNGPYGFDCSGLTSYIYRNHGITLQRRASLQLQDGVVVAKEGLQVGDLLFFKEPGETYPVSHVGMYAGDNQMIHAGTKGIAYADLDSYWYSSNYLCARRIVITDSSKTVMPLGVGLEGNAVAQRAMARRRIFD